MPERATVISPAEANDANNPFPFDFFERRCLAQGDSWFSLGAMPPTLTTRVVAELRPKRSTVVVNCARPGEILRRMTNTTRHPDFLKLLRGRTAMRWHAILLSGGGNDLIEAVGAPPSAPPEQRLLRTPAERGAGPHVAAEFISEPGWAKFAEHIATVFAAVLAERDAGINRDVPLLWHDYARVMPTAVGASMGAGGPWLSPALAAYGVPRGVALAVSDELIGRLGSLVRACAAGHAGRHVHVVDSQGAGLVLAEPDATGPSGDWFNEIHPTKAGYAKVAAKWVEVLDPLFG